MDGRCQVGALAFVKEHSGADNIDTITEPGLDLLLSGRPYPLAPDNASSDFVKELLAWEKKKAEISVKGHGAKQAYIIAHCTCAGNPCAYGDHLECLRASRDTVKNWGLYDEVHIVAFDDEWKIAEID
jgi:hypothetical protein